MLERFATAKDISMDLRFIILGLREETFDAEPARVKLGCGRDRLARATKPCYKQKSIASE